MTIHLDDDSNTTAPKERQAVLSRKCILVCQHRSCLRIGSDQVLKAFQAYISPNLMVSASSCLGLCGSGPNVRVIPDDIWYCRVKTSDVPLIFEHHLQHGKPIKRLLHTRLHPQYDAYSYNAEEEDEDAGSASEA